MLQDMTTENTPRETEQAVDPLTPETFSFFDNIEGLNYATSTINVYMNERALALFSANNQDIADAEDGADISHLIEKRDKLSEAILKSQYTFELSGVSDDEVTEAKTQADERFAGKMKQVKAADGTLVKRLPEAESLNYTRFFNALVMSLHVKKITDPLGRVSLDPSADEIALFMDKAPTLEKQRLSIAISDLRVSAAEFEARIDADFLAKP